MKTLKSKLLASAAMLMLSVIMVTSASFAWFTISTNPEIKGMTTQVVVNDNLEIALDADYDNGPLASGAGDSGNAYTWGNILDLTAGDAKTAYDELDKTLRPVELDDGDFKYPIYGADGRIDSMETMDMQVLGDDKETAFGNLIDDEDATTPTNYGYYVDFWVRSNKTGIVMLSEAANRVGTDDDATAGSGSIFEFGSATVTDAEKELSKHIRVAFMSVDEEDDDALNKNATAMTTKYPETPNGKATFEGDVVALTANEAKKVRMFVYLDGTTATNAVASLSGVPEGDEDEVADIMTKGKLNIQFALRDSDDEDLVLVSKTDMAVNAES